MWILIQRILAGIGRALRRLFGLDREPHLAPAPPLAPR